MYDCTNCRVKGNSMTFHRFAPLYSETFLKPSKIKGDLHSALIQENTYLSNSNLFFKCLDNSSNIYYFEKGVFFRKTMEMEFSVNNLVHISASVHKI